MRVAIALSATGGPWGDFVTYAQEAERLGVAIYFVAEAWGTDAVSPLAYLAAKTERILLASGIMQISARTPVTTAYRKFKAIFVSAGADLLSTPVELRLTKSVFSRVVPHEGYDNALLPHMVFGFPLSPARRQPGGLASHPPSLGARLGASAHAGRFYGEGSCPQAAARRTGGAGMPADRHASPSTGRQRGHHRRRTRPWLVGTYEPVRSRRGVCNTPGAVRWAGGNP
jgi:Luciferase-like monooxygenase